MTKYAAAILIVGLSACSGPDFEGLAKQMQACGTDASQFYQPEIGTIAPAPAGDAVAGSVNPGSQKCVTDWAKDNGFKVLTAEELQKLLKETGAP